jgi:hypothetical protein
MKKESSSVVMIFSKHEKGKFFGMYVTIQSLFLLRHCERSEAIHTRGERGLLRFARNDENTLYLNWY